MRGTTHREKGDARAPTRGARARPPLFARMVLTVTLLLVVALASACAEARVHYTFEEDGSYRVEGTVFLTQQEGAAYERLLELRRRLEQFGITTTDLAEPGRLGFTFAGDSTNDMWAQQQAGGGPRLWTDQGLLSKKYVFYWPLDWDIYVEGVAPENIDGLEAAFFQASDIRVTATFPGDGARHNGDMGGGVEAGSGGRTIAWQVLPLEPGFMRAEHTAWVWWRVALVPAFLLIAAALVVARLYRSLRTAAVPRPSAGAAMPTRAGSAGGGAPPERVIAAPERVVLLDATAACPVCDAPVVPGEACVQCVATAEAATRS